MAVLGNLMAVLCDSAVITKLTGSSFSLSGIFQKSSPVR